jgi:hypothetical protein
MSTDINTQIREANNMYLRTVSALNDLKSKNPHCTVDDARSVGFCTFHLYETLSKSKLPEGFDRVVSHRISEVVNILYVLLPPLAHAEYRKPCA